MKQQADETKLGFMKFFTLVIIMLFVFMFRHFVMNRIIVSGKSMEPNFVQNDICWEQRINYRINRYDVVVAKANNEKFIKRVIGLPGDEIVIKDKTVLINGRPINSKYAYTTYANGKSNCLDTTEKIFVCRENEYFLLGDNRQHSKDSRMFGCVSKEDITGRVVFRFYPLNRISKL
ncbi:MAG: signal peptidase I [Pseudobutyrivibrio sp.]|nr:signal peptidase I [Pseudobutyrivibrio sp.]